MTEHLGANVILRVSYNRIGLYILKNDNGERCLLSATIHHLALLKADNSDPLAFNKYVLTYVNAVAKIEKSELHEDWAIRLFRFFNQLHIH